MSKPYEAPLDPELAFEILNIPMPEESAPPPTTIGERVQRSVESVEAANEYLATSPMAHIIADTLMRKLKKRGNPRIQVRMDGTVVLVVSYEDHHMPKPDIGVQTRPRKSSLPTMDELREWAGQIGVDISGMGRKRRAIYEMLQKEERPQTSRRLIDEVTESEAPDEPARKVRRRRTADL